MNRKDTSFITDFLERTESRLMGDEPLVNIYLDFKRVVDRGAFVGHMLSFKYINDALSALKQASDRPEYRPRARAFIRELLQEVRKLGDTPSKAERAVLKAAGEKGVKFPSAAELDQQAMVKIRQAVREAFDAFSHLEDASRKVSDRDYRGEVLSRLRIMGTLLHELDALKPGMG